MNSCLYDCQVMHHRLRPLKNQFNYRIFMFYLDLDELNQLDRTHRFFGHNRFNMFTFRDDDHLPLGDTIRASIETYLAPHGINLQGGRIMLLTNCRVMGYVFNPVSFYFCFDAADRPVCVVPEVGNTFGEMKPYFLGRDTLTGGQFQRRMTKYFYVSPFIDHDTQFDFQLGIPDERLHIRIDDYDADDRLLISTLTGRQLPLTDGNLLKMALRYPLVTVQIIGLIHWQALKLYLRKLTYHPKKAAPHLQRDFYDMKQKTSHKITSLHERSRSYG